MALGIEATRPAAAGSSGPVIGLFGLLLDGAGEPIVDGLIETWQSESPSFARSLTEDDGRWNVVVPRPQPLAGQAPHIAISVFARGLLQRLVTRVYLPDDAEANACDPVLAAVSSDRRGTLIAEACEDGEYRFDIRIQGRSETVFFDV